MGAVLLKLKFAKFDTLDTDCVPHFHAFPPGDVTCYCGRLPSEMGIRMGLTVQPHRHGTGAWGIIQRIWAEREEARLKKPIVRAETPGFSRWVRIRILHAMKRFVIALSIVAAGCSSSPTAPTPPPVINVPPPVVVAPPVVTPPVVVAPPPDPLLSDPRFSLAFYRQMIQDAYELPNARRPLYRWTRPPMVYLRTVDESNLPVDGRLLDQTAAAIINTTSAWAGGQFGVAVLERGTGTRAGQAQWLTVEWSRSGGCGATNTPGVEGVVITMNHRRPECTCGPLVAKHELGHAMGFYHTDSSNDLMVATFQGVCDKPLSEREQFHARVAYNQPVGSLDPR